MSIKRLAWAIILLAVIGGLAWAATLWHVPRPAGTSAGTSPVLHGAATTTDQGSGFEYTEEHPYYTIDVVYPDTGNTSEQTAIETELKSHIDDYTQSVADLDPSMMPSLSQGYKLMLSATYKKYTGQTPAGAVASYFFTVYSDTGGAHPNAYFTTFTFDQSGNELAITDIANLQKLSAAAGADVAAQIKQRLGQGDVSGALFSDGLAPTAANYSNFVVDGSDLLIEIPPYQVAAYAMGSFEVRVPLSQVSQ